MPASQGPSSEVGCSLSILDWTPAFYWRRCVSPCCVFRFLIFYAFRFLFCECLSPSYPCLGLWEALGLCLCFGSIWTLLGLFDFYVCCCCCLVLRFVFVVLSFWLVCVLHCRAKPRATLFLLGLLWDRFELFIKQALTCFRSSGLVFSTKICTIAFFGCRVVLYTLRLLCLFFFMIGF